MVDSIRGRGRVRKREVASTQEYSGLHQPFSASVHWKVTLGDVEVIYAVGFDEETPRERLQRRPITEVHHVSRCARVS